MRVSVCVWENSEFNSQFTVHSVVVLLCCCLLFDMSTFSNLHLLYFPEEISKFPTFAAPLSNFSNAIFEFRISNFEFRKQFSNVRMFECSIAIDFSIFRFFECALPVLIFDF